MNGERPTIASVHGLAAAAHPLAAAGGARILRAGGNAFDAAVAVAAALGVVEPFMSGICGSGIATIYAAREERVRCLEFRSGVPQGFEAGRFHDREQLYRGPLATTAPGSLAGWAALLEWYGTMTLAQVLEPAMALAADGFPLIAYNASSINAVASDLAKYPFYADWCAVHRPGDQPATEGAVLRQPDLAATFQALGAEGPGLLYGGALGRKLVAHVQALGGCLTMADLEAVKPHWVEPTRTEYRHLTVHAPPPPCSAWQFLLALRILDGFNLTILPRDGVEHLDLVWRAIRLAAGVRVREGAPGPARLAELLADPAVEALRARARDGVPVEGPTEQWLAPPEAPVAGQHTTSLSVADRHGNIVCLTQSLGARFGCGVVVPGTGLCLSNGLYWGETDPRGPNALVPGRILGSSMSPTIVLREGQPVLALGTPGSYGITQTQVQALVQWFDFARPLQAAIEAPRARLWDGRRVQAESRIAPDVLAGLTARGHAVEAPAPWTMAAGGMQGIAFNPRTGVMTGAADPRRAGYAVAV